MTFSFGCQDKRRLCRSDLTVVVHWLDYPMAEVIMAMVASCARFGMGLVWFLAGDKLRQPVKLSHWRATSVGSSSLAMTSFGNPSHNRWMVNVLCF